MCLPMYACRNILIERSKDNFRYHLHFFVVFETMTLASLELTKQVRQSAGELPEFAYLCSPSS